MKSGKGGEWGGGGKGARGGGEKQKQCEFNKMQRQKSIINGGII